MNPETNSFEMLSKYLETDDTGNQFKKLLRPNGEPVPAHWPVFRVDEEIVVKDYTFKVAHIGEKHLLLEPVGIPEIGPGKKHEEILDNNPKRRRRG